MLPLEGRVALVTGVSRRIGIGAGIAKRLLADGARVFTTGWNAHDAEMPWGEDPEGIDALLNELGGQGERLAYRQADLEDPAAPEAMIAAVVERFGSIDIVVANHARSSHEGLFDVSVEELDRCWAANARASLLLARGLGTVRKPGPGGRLILFTSGQHLGPMSREIAYAVTKGAIHQMTASLSEELIRREITVNCINPGPIDTGYATGDSHRAVAKRFPGGQWGMPDDVARLVAWLASDEGRWITGQILNSEGGFRHHK
jgi:3-oxoacyl-[acyl-carrier protein] reductase